MEALLLDLAKHMRSVLDKPLETQVVVVTHVPNFFMAKKDANCTIQYSIQKCNENTPFDFVDDEDWVLTNNDYDWLVTDNAGVTQRYHRVTELFRFFERLFGTVDILDMYTDGL